MPRPAKPWYRAQKNGWCITLNGRIVSLGVQGKANRKEALAAWHRLVIEGKSEETPKALTVAELGEAFPTDVRARLKPNTRLVRAIGERSDHRARCGNRRQPEHRGG